MTNTLRGRAARPTHAPVILHRAVSVGTLGLALLVALPAPDAAAQRAPERVLVRSLDAGSRGPLPVDRGTPGLRHRLEKLRTTGSVLYTSGHPDEEEAGALTLLSRGLGVRTALLTLNRGEDGTNARGPELFDALGLLRTEELRPTGRYYALDEQYFTAAADYGYSKTLDEAVRSWDRKALVEDMVRIIRTNRPLVVMSRRYGDERDGHGHHQAGDVLMVACANRSALEATLATGEMHFWSRSRGALWKKGETSGNVLRVASLTADCDADTVLALVRPTSPACHTGDRTCFGDGGEATLSRLDGTLAERASSRPARSYTVRLLDDRNLRLKKLGEEVAELVSALATSDRERAVEEAADLLYHTLVGLRAEGVGLPELPNVLDTRAG